MSLHSPTPPDITLAFARLEAHHFGVPLATTRLGNVILRVSEQPEVMEAMHTYQPPPEVPVDQFDYGIRAVRLLGENMTVEEVGAQLGVSPHTVTRRTSRLYRALGTASPSATARRLIEQGSIQTSELPYAGGSRVPLTIGEKLLSYVTSRGWSSGSLRQRSGVNCRSRSLHGQAGVTNATALTMSLFARGQLVPDPELHNLWKQSGGYPHR